MNSSQSNPFNARSNPNNYNVVGMSAQGSAVQGFNFSQMQPKPNVVCPQGQQPKNGACVISGGRKTRNKRRSKSTRRRKRR